MFCDSKNFPIFVVWYSFDHQKNMNKKIKLIIYIVLAALEAVFNSLKKLPKNEKK